MEDTPFICLAKNLFLTDKTAVSPSDSCFVCNTIFITFHSNYSFYYIHRITYSFPYCLRKNLILQALIFAADLLVMMTPTIIIPNIMPKHRPPRKLSDRSVKTRIM